MSSFRFFASESLRQKLVDSTPKVILFGGFNGGCWNFGDLVQLLSVAKWYKVTAERESVIPIFGLSQVTNDIQMERLTLLLGSDDFIFYGEARPDLPSALQVGNRSLYEIADALEGTRNVFHLYGGGYLNMFWGAWQLKIIEGALNLLKPDLYAISGQQVDPDFLMSLTDHLKAYEPILFGCRDTDSLATLSSHGLQALYSGDDSWEVLRQSAGTILNAGATRGKGKNFGLHINLSWYTSSDTLEDQQEGLSRKGLLLEIENAFSLLQRRFGRDGCPLVVSSFPNDRVDTLDSLSSVEKTLFALYFPTFAVADLSGLLFHNRLQDLGSLISDIQLFISNSYHTALLFKMLGIPTLLCSFNQYYLQKARGVGQESLAIAEFLNLDLDEYLNRQVEWLQQTSKQRAEWLEILGSRLNSF